MSRHAQELAKAHAQAVALRDALKTSVRNVNRILARVERAMRTAAQTQDAATTTQAKDGNEGWAVVERGRA